MDVISENLNTITKRKNNHTRNARYVLLVIVPLRSRKIQYNIKYINEQPINNVVEHILTSTQGGNMMTTRPHTLHQALH